MKRFEKKIVTEEMIVLQEITCDLCKQTIPYDHNGETIIRLEIYEGYVKIRYDLCPVCYREKLLPWLEMQAQTVPERPSS